MLKTTIECSNYQEPDALILMKAANIVRMKLTLM